MRGQVCAGLAFQGLVDFVKVVQKKWLAVVSLDGYGGTCFQG